jgi:hypothetical protein
VHFYILVEYKRMKLRSGKSIASKDAPRRGRTKSPPNKRAPKPKSRKQKSRKKKPPTIYCGNNAAVLGDDLVAGTPYSCLQKGYMYGRHHMPVDMSYAAEYEHLTPRKIWCGKKTLTVAELRRRGYDYNGILPECLRYGLGAGRRDKARAEGVIG